MEINTLSLYSELPNDVLLATKLLVETYLTQLHPFLHKLGRNIKTSLKDEKIQEKVTNIYNVFTLCVSQINKCHATIFEILKLENQKHFVLLESRNCMLERISWCGNRLECINNRLKEIENEIFFDSCLDDSVFATPMYFVNWIDQTFDILNKLTELINSFGSNKDLQEERRNEIIELISSLHTLSDELLLSAMTLCKYCLPADQYVIKARCQVVLRETKALLNDVIDGDVESLFDDSIISLKLPIKPTNVNVLIDVLKDALYVLETNTNTALLSLLVHCFSHSISPVEVLKRHYVGNKKGMCECILKSDDEITETCNYVKEFDLHNERLLQIGSFAVSCSSDKKRTLTLRSNLATLEALDPHLVPALIMAPASDHSSLLKDSWNKEVLEIRDSIFLIVDPAAFAEKSKQMMHQKLLDILKENLYENDKICSFINIGSVIYEFFSVYNKYEPDAINEREKLVPLLADLNKAQLECKAVSDLLATGEDFVYNIKRSKSTKVISIEQVHKRLKLLYTLVTRINTVLRPKDNEDEYFANEEELRCDVTHSIRARNDETYVNSPRKVSNALTRSVFARTTNIRTPYKVPLFQLTKNLKQRKTEHLNFSAQLEELCNGTGLVASPKDSLTFFYSPMRKRPSLRKAILNRHKLTLDNEGTIDESRKMFEESELVDDSIDFQITEVLNQMNDLSDTFSPDAPKDDATFQYPNAKNTAINTSNADVNGSLMTSNTSQPSHITTLERLIDLDLVESRLSDLRVLQLETSL